MTPLFDKSTKFDMDKKSVRYILYTKKINPIVQTLFSVEDDEPVDDSSPKSPSSPMYRNFHKMYSLI